MKANRITNNSRILTTIGLFIFAISVGYGQGLLAEGAMKLFKVNKPVTEVNEPEFIFAGYSTENEDSFNLKNFVRDAFTVKQEVEESSEISIDRTIHASAVDISFEAEIETEKWMTTPLESNLEAAIPVEKWMTKPLTESVESKLEVESWMTETFSGSLETELRTESWMAQPFSESLESEIEVENWMTESFIEEKEEELILEDWMTQLLISE